MNKKIIFGRSIKDLVVAAGPSTLLFLLACFVAYKFVNPAPPNHLVLATGEGEGDYELYANLYKDILKRDGVEIEVRASGGTLSNLHELSDDTSDVDVGFVQDGVGSLKETPGLLSLGSLYYEPLWIFYRSPKTLTKLSQLQGSKIAVGRPKGGTRILALKLFDLAGITSENSTLVEVGDQKGSEALRSGQVQAAVFLGTPDDPLIESLLEDRSLHLMNLDQAEAITRQVPYLHHLVLPHGAVDLKENIPAEDVQLVAPTATLVTRDDLHPALAYLLLKAAREVHSSPGLLERKDEFPSDADYQFPLSNEAKYFYKSGTPFWQRYLPFWLATLVERFIFVVLPVIVILLPLVRLVPQIYSWRVRNRIYKRYGELKFLETQIKPERLSLEYLDWLEQLDVIEERVNSMKVPLDFSEHIYSLRGHIDFVRARLHRLLTTKRQAAPEV